MTTDYQCTRAAEQAQLQTEWVVVQVGAGQPRPRGLPSGTALLVATEVPHDPHMAVHVLEDQPEGTGHLVVHQRGGPAWLREHVTALRSWASTIAGAEIRLHDHPAIRPGDTKALSVDQLTPSHPDVRWHSANLNAGWLSPTGYYWIPEAWGHTSSDASGGGPCKHATSVALAANDYGRLRTTGVPAGAAKVVNQIPLRWHGTACAGEDNTPGTRSGMSEPPHTTATPYCTRRTWRRPRTPSYRTRPRALATPNSSSPIMTATSTYGPPRCGHSARARSEHRRTMR